MLLEHRDVLRSPALAPYLAALPRAADLHMPFLWSDAELDMLRGSSLRDKAADVKAGIEDEWRHVCATLDRAYSLPDYTWAQAIVASRAFALGGPFPLVLAPGVDLAAHAAVGDDPTARVLSAGGGLFSKPKVLLCATRDLAAGDAVTLRYADDAAGVADYVLDYGFVPGGGGGGGGGAHTLVDLRFSLASLDPFYDDKVDIVEGAGVPTAAAFALSSEETRGVWLPPDNLEAFLRLVCLSARDAFLLEAVFRGEAWDFMQLPVSADNERAMCEAVIAACDDALDAYADGAGGAGAGGADAEPGAQRAAIARAVVDGERALLQRAKEYYQRELGSLTAKEYYQERRLKALDLLRPLDESEIVDAEAGARMGQAFDERY